MNLENFKTNNNLFEATTQFLKEQLQIKFTPFTNQAFTAQQFFNKNEHRAANKNIALVSKFYVMGVVNYESLTNTISKITIEDLKNQTKDYDGLVICALQINDNQKPNRTQLAEITRLINREFPTMPVMVLFRYDSKISIANTERIPYLINIEGEKVGKVSMLKDIEIEKPHRAHQDILKELATHKAKTFEELYKYWQEKLNTKELNKKFFKKIANWYFWAVHNSKFPFEYLKNQEKYQTKTDEELQELANQKATIRFITRIIFVWFLKEKKLIEDKFFDKNYIKKILKDSPDNYYNAILQNLFFATLNRPTELRNFAKDEGFNKNKTTNFDVNSLYRYEKMFQDTSSENIMKLFEKIPFLNGGLFDSLDSKNKEQRIIIDGFSRNEKWQAKMPDFLFFEKDNIDFNEELRKIYDKKNEKYEVKGLFAIFEEHKFTIEENTPLETDVALDPYLLGEIFENLLAYYNPETGSTARKGTGSFYTPQEIVNYMVDESLLAYLQNDFPDLTTFEKLSNLEPKQKHQIVKKLSEVKILDPACGSGAFPMGVLYKMVDLLKNVDSDNKIWKQIQHDKIIGDKIAELEADKKAIAGLSDLQVKEKATKAVDDRLQDLENIFNNEYNEDDYSRKLYIIQNCIYGVDIQDVAIQISKLRFFLSLIVDQKNNDIQPLPNLETKFVIANTLIGLSMDNGMANMIDFNHYLPNDEKEKQFLDQQIQFSKEQYFTLPVLKEKLKEMRHKHFKIKTKNEKNTLEKADELIRQMIQNALLSNGFPSETAHKIATFNIYNQNAQADWFDMDWMFGIQDGFDVVIGNPPYVDSKKLKSYSAFYKSNYKCYTGSADLYVYFYENGINLLRENGVLSYITSNKWIRSEYGKNLRSFFLENNPQILVDFGTNRVFDATVDSNIIIVKKNKNKSEFNICVFRDNFKKLDDFQDYLNENLTKKIKILNGENWNLSDEENTNFKNKIQKIGKPLKEFGFTFYRGVLTGLNEAFIIDEKTKEFLVSKDSKNNEIIKPIIQGKNINKFLHKNSNLFLINSHNGVKSKNINPIKVEENYPIIYKHLESFMPQINKRTDKGIHWSNLRNCGYIDEFRNQKIIWQGISKRIEFSYDDSGVFCDVTSFFMTGKNLKYFLSIFNSKFFEYSILNFYLEGDTFKSKNQILQQFPIPEIPEPAQQPFITLVNEILEGKKSGQDTSHLEHQIDVMVYHLYGLSYEEACVIDKELKEEDFEKHKI